MRILKNPENWKDLQNKVGEILTQCGFKVDIEKNIKSTRSEIEIDVFAEESIEGRSYIILCECKMWSSNIPQLYVHGLRTVVSDIGANIGYIITTSDFQKSSKDSIKNSNVKLLTWDEFQKSFFKSWYLNYFSRELQSLIKSIYDPPALQFYDDFTKINKDEYKSLIEKYNTLQRLDSHFPSFVLRDFPVALKDFELKLPLIEKLDWEIWEIQSSNLPKAILQERHYSTFLELIYIYAIPIYSRLAELDIDNDI